MIRIRELTLSRGGRELLTGAECLLSHGERVALIGPNGCGKTTLLGALAGEVIPDSGEIENSHRRITRLSQSLPVSDQPAWRYLIDGDAELVASRAELIAAEQAMANSDSSSLPGQTSPHAERDDAHGLRLAQAHARWLEAGGADAEPRAHALLDGLGFSPGQAHATVNTLSGGWRMRLNLARALFAPGDLLLLDEPTNHLDLDAVIWLERWLVRCPCTMVIVSHDRDFIDHVVKACLTIEQGKLGRYSGGYSDFERQLAARQLQQQREQQNVAEQRAHLETFIRRFRAQANRARQVQSRIRALERMAEVAPIRALRGIDIVLPSIGECPETLIQTEGLAAGYGDQVIVRLKRLQITRGSRIGILGRNGAGKSTLIRTLVGEQAALAGEHSTAKGLRIGYFAQQGVESLRADESPLQHMQRHAPEAREQVLRDSLGRFGFRGDDAVRPTGPMSGGEKARLLLALMLWSKPQMLILDEPTNHLDAQTRDALADALAEFDGALLLVSHDRYLLRSSVDRLLIVDGGELREYDGDLDDYHEWTTRRSSQEATSQAAPGTGAPARPPEAESPGNRASSSPAPAPVDRREARRLAAERRAAIAARTRAFDTEIGTLEKTLASIESEMGRIESQLMNPDLYGPGSSPGDLADLNRERARLSREKDEAETRWLELQEAREQAIASVDIDAD